MLVGKPEGKSPPGLRGPKCGNDINIIPQERGRVGMWFGLLLFRIEAVAVSCENCYKPSDATRCRTWDYFHPVYFLAVHKESFTFTFTKKLLGSQWKLCCIDLSFQS
jgi:hypothetical protein